MAIKYIQPPYTSKCRIRAKGAKNLTQATENKTVAGETKTNRKRKTIAVRPIHETTRTLTSNHRRLEPKTQSTIQKRKP